MRVGSNQMVPLLLVLVLVSLGFVVWYEFGRGNSVLQSRRMEKEAATHTVHDETTNYDEAEMRKLLWKWLQRAEEGKEGDTATRGFDGVIKGVTSSTAASAHFGTHLPPKLEPTMEAKSQKSCQKPERRRRRRRRRKKKRRLGGKRLGRRKMKRNWNSQKSGEGNEE